MLNVFLAGQKHFGASVYQALRSAPGVVVVGVSTPATGSSGKDRLRLQAEQDDCPWTEAGPKLKAADIPAGTDLIVCAHAHQYVTRRAREKALLGAIGWHPSELPKYPGKDAIEQAVAAGETSLRGVVYRLTGQMDAGPVLRKTAPVEIPAGASARQAWELLAPRGAELLAGAVVDLAAGRLDLPAEAAPTGPADRAGEGKYRNRIVEYRDVPIGEILFNDHNWRKPGKRNPALKASLERLGILKPVLINGNTGRLVNGHKRVMLYDAAGLETVHAAILDLTEEEERLALATLDPIAEMAEADAATLDALLHQTETGHADLQALAADLAAENGLYADTPEPAEPDGTEDFDPDTSLDQYGVLVPCRDEDHNEAVYQALLAEGYNCKVVVT